MFFIIGYHQHFVAVFEKSNLSPKHGFQCVTLRVIQIYTFVIFLNNVDRQKLRRNSYFDVFKSLVNRMVYTVTIVIDYN